MSHVNAILDLDRSLPERELLIEIAGELAKIASFSDDKANANALNKAAYHLTAGLAFALSAGDFLIPSGTRAGTVYRVSGAGCSCEAGRHGRPCWHASLAEITVVAWERLDQEDDGDVAGEEGDEPPPAVFEVVTVERCSPATLGERLAVARRALMVA